MSSFLCLVSTAVSASNASTTENSGRLDHTAAGMLQLHNMCSQKVGLCVVGTWFREVSVCGSPASGCSWDSVRAMATSAVISSALFWGSPFTCMASMHVFLGSPALHSQKTPLELMLYSTIASLHSL